MLTVFAVLFALWLFVFAGLWVWGAASSSGGPADVMIILGAQVRPDGTPNWVLLSRLETALDRWQSAPLPVVCCGGQGADEPLPEAVSMKNWLVSHGIPEDMILTDETSVNTYENLDNALPLLPEGAQTVLVVTSDYHLPRALAVARLKGLNARGLGSPVYFTGRLRNHTREALSWLKFLYLRLTGRL